MPDESTSARANTRDTFPRYRAFCMRCDASQILTADGEACNTCRQPINDQHARDARTPRA